MNNGSVADWARIRRFAASNRDAPIQWFDEITSVFTISQSGLGFLRAEGAGRHEGNRSRRRDINVDIFVEHDPGLGFVFPPARPMPFQITRHRIAEMREIDLAANNRRNGRRAIADPGEL